MPFTQGHALLIGVNTYVHAAHINVPVTARDAQRLETTLQTPALCAYPAAQVKRLSDVAATRAAILAALDDLATAGEDDTVLLFYAGHGAFTAGGDYCLTTHDTRLQGNKVVEGTAISQAELFARLNAIPAKRLLLLFNACHAGQLSPDSLDVTDEPVDSFGENLSAAAADAILATGEGRILITACRPGQKSWIGVGDITIFAQAIVDGLSGQGYVTGNRGYIGAYDLYEHIYLTAREKAAQLAYAPLQEPELTVHKGIGPFPVALFRGSANLGDFDADQVPPPDTAVRAIDPERSRRMYAKITGDRNIQIGGDAVNSVLISGDSNVVQGSRSYHDSAHAEGGGDATVYNAPVSRTAFDQRGQHVGGSQTNVAGDMHVGRDFTQGASSAGQPTPEAVIAQMRHLLTLLQTAQEAGLIDEDTAIDVGGQIKKATNRAEKDEPDKPDILDHLTRAKDFVENTAAAAGLIAAIQQTIQSVQQAF